MDTTRSRRFPAAVLAAVSALLIVVGCSSAPKEPEILAAPNPNMPTIGDFVSVGDLEVRVDDVDQRRSFDPADYDLPDSVTSRDSGSRSDSGSDSGASGDSGSRGGSGSGTAAHGPRPTLADGSTAVPGADDSRGSGGAKDSDKDSDSDKDNGSDKDHGSDNGSNGDSDKDSGKGPDSDKDHDSGKDSGSRDREGNGDSDGDGGADATSSSGGGKLEAGDGRNFGVFEGTACLAEDNSLEVGVQLQIHTDLATVAAAGYQPVPGLSAVVVGEAEADDACAGSQFKIVWVFDLPEDERPSSMGLVDADDDMAGRQVIDLGAGGGEQCEDYDVDLMETRIGYWLVGDALQTRGPAIWDLSVDNQFDPCVELSWIVVHSKKEEWTVVFFRGTELVEDPAPVIIDREPVVERRGTGEVRVDYICDGHVVDYIVDGDGVRADGVDDVSVDRVDFTKANFGSDAPMRYLGNARHSPYDYEIPLEGSETVHFRVPLDGDGSETVNCSAGGMEDFVCEDPSGKRWEAADLTSYDAGNTPAGEPANRFVVVMSLPYGAYTESASADLPDSGPVIPADGVTRVGWYAVDTRGPGMAVGNSFTGYRVGTSGPVEEAEPVMKIDQSRWPDYEELRPPEA